MVTSKLQTKITLFFALTLTVGLLIGLMFVRNLEAIGTESHCRHALNMLAHQYAITNMDVDGAIHQLKNRRDVPLNYMANDHVIFSSGTKMLMEFTCLDDIKRGILAYFNNLKIHVLKRSLVFDLGTIDELSGTISIVRSTCSFTLLSKELENIQCSLFEIGSCVAANNRSSRFTLNDSTLITNLDKRIDEMTKELPELYNFILPGGSSQTGSYLHFSRAVCRRCERLLTKWLHDQNEEEEQPPQQDTVMGIYLNRLSDYLFTLARYITYEERHQDIIYHKSK